MFDNLPFLKRLGAPATPARDAVSRDIELM